MFAAPSAQADHLTISFRGADRSHVSYSIGASAYRQIQLRVLEPSGATVTLAEAEGENAFQGSWQHLDLVPGTYEYSIRRRFYNIATGSWEAWDVIQSESLEMDGSSVDGTLLFDERIEDVTVHSVIVPAARTLEIAGSLSAPTEDLDSAIWVYGSLSPVGATALRPGERGPILVTLYAAHSLSSLSGGVFVLEADGSVLSDCDNLRVRPHADATLSDIVEGQIDLGELPADTVLTIRDSSVGPSGIEPCVNGTVALENVVWSGPGKFQFKARLEATGCDFKGLIEITGDNTADSAGFVADHSLFQGIGITRAAPGNVVLQDCLFAGQVAIHGGQAEFDSCEFGSAVSLWNRSGAILHNNLFMRELVFSSSHPGDAVYPDTPRWYEAAQPSPTIADNAFLGETALVFQHITGVPSLPPVPISIGANYFGDARGFYNSITLGNGFLGAVSGHAGTLLKGNTSSNAFLVATPLASSPAPTQRRDLRVFPSFWMNGHIVGQNTLCHSTSNLDGTPRPCLKGRDTLVSIDLMTTEHTLKGARVYAEWNGAVIDAAPVAVMHRDQAHHSPNAILAGLTTYNIVLPGVQTSSMPMQVFLDASGVAGFDPESYPAQPQLLLSGALAFVNPPERKFRISVIPLQINGLFGGSWGTANAAAVMNSLRKDLPDMLPIPANKLDIVERPVLSIWSPTTFITAIGMMNNVAANLTMNRAFMGLFGDVPDFIVVVVPRGVIGSSDGANLALRRNILFTDEARPSAVLHELGHGIGLYNGINAEQYVVLPPNGQALNKVTRFETETPLAFGRVRHLPSPGQAWFDKDYINYDIMGAADPSWASLGTLDSFHQWFQTNLAVPTQTVASAARTLAPRAEAPEPGMRRILVSGVISNFNFLADTLNIFDVTTLDVPSLPPAAGSTHYFRAFDAQGVQIHETLFFGKTTQQAWAATFDVPEQAESCRLVKWSDGSLVKRVDALGLQTPQLLSPMPGDQIGPLFEASWSTQAVSGSSTASILHALYFKTSPGGAWTLVVGPTAATEIHTPSTFLPATEYLALKLVSSDGLRSVEHVVEGLSVPERAPIVAILNPQPGETSASNATWRLAASIRDFGESAPTGSWTSSIQGPLGEGADLRVALNQGTHVLRHQVESSNGQAGFAETTVTVYEAISELDLGFDPDDLRLHNTLADPTGLTPMRVVTQKVNRVVLRLRNRGGQGAARVRTYLRPPTGVEALVDTSSLALDPFETRYIAVDFLPTLAGSYTVRAVIDQIEPSDPDATDNERSWTFSSLTPKITLNRNPPAGGVLSGAGSYVYGANAIVHADPNLGYAFVNWTEGAQVVAQDPTFSFQATSNRTLWANFTTRTHLLTYAPGAGGQVSGTSSQRVNYSESGSAVTAQAEAGAVFERWSDGVQAATRQDTNVTADLSVIARFSTLGGVQIDWYAEHGVTPGPDENWSDLDDQVVPGKGMTLREAWIADSDPNDSNDFFRFTKASPGNQFVLNFNSSTSRLYTLHSTFNLIYGPWTNVPGASPRRGTGSADSMTDTNQPPCGSYYRIGVGLP